MAKVKKSNYWGDRYLHILDSKAAIAEEQLIKEYQGLLVRTKADMLDMFGDDSATALYTFDKYFKFCNNLERNLEKLGIKSESVIDKALTDMYKQVSDELQKRLGFKIGNDFAGMNDGKNVINQIWCQDGLAWSDRVWRNKAMLQDKLTSGMYDIWVRGGDTKSVIDDITNLVNDNVDHAYARAKMLVNTELAHIGTMASLDCYQKAGAYGVMVHTMHDDKVCEEDAEHDGEIVPFNQCIEGETIPPFHPNCRCYLTAVFETEE